MLKDRNVQSVYVIGSFLDESQIHQKSDLDLVVKGLDPEDFFKVYSKGARKFPRDMDSLDLIPYEDANPNLQKEVKQNGLEIKEDQTLDEFLNNISRITEKAG